MRRLIGESVFAVGTRQYFWDDVVLAGLVWGDWSVLERDVAHGVACLARARAENTLPTHEQLNAAASSFRYERNLITAEEASDWLARWKLRAEDWVGYLRRNFLRGRWPNASATGEERFSPSAETGRCLYAEAVCSGTLERLARELAARAACVARSDGPSSVSSAGPPQDEGGSLVTDSLLAAACRLGLTIARSSERLELLAEVERSYRGFRNRVLAASAAEKEIRAHQMEWTRVACDSVSFETDAAAREALLCVRADGQRLRDVAAAARREAKHELICPDRSASPIGEQLRGARAGDALGPFVVDGSFVVLEVRDRIPPTSTDPEIVRRAEFNILARATLRDLTPSIQWQKAF